MGIKVNGVQIAGMGKEGTPGKSAYEYAREAGYTGTEEEFKIAMKNFGENFAGASGSDVFFYIDTDGDVVPKTAEEMR